ncbi:MAG: amidase [Opitutaceae bacterium]|nr:amidase [Opitutaceae bacterium]
MPFPDVASPNSFAFWHDLAARSPGDAARLFHRRVAALDETERRAIFAFVPDEKALAHAFETGVRHGGPLAGVPFVVKDLFSIEGHKVGAGSRFLASQREPEVIDAPIVRRLRHEGAVFAGITHLHEFAYGITGENPHFGDCPNPRLPGRVTGGSSSGSVACVAGGIAPLGIGTDTGGSIRLPAAFCGVWGHRGEPYAEFTEHCFPLAPSFDTAGWFTTTLHDLTTTMRALYGPAPFRPTNKPLGRVPALLLPSELDPTYAQHLDAAAREISEALPDDLLRQFLDATADAANAFAVIQGVEASSIHAPWIDPLREEYDPVVWGRLDRGRKRTEAELAAAQVTRDRIHRAFADIFTQFSGLVLPAAPFPALTKAGCTEEARRRILQLTSPCSHAALPALAVPVALPGGAWSALQVITPGPQDALGLV